jgi:uncharacterized glyoxalase superfamily protein PhnB
VGRIVPYLLYEDVVSALDFLAVAFGFREEMRYVGPDGIVTHAEMRYGADAIMMGAPGGGYQGPHRHGLISQEVLVFVDDVDAHYARAAGAGATILDEPADQEYGDRRYRAGDPEGHRWSFHQHLT